MPGESGFQKKPALSSWPTLEQATRPAEVFHHHWDDHPPSFWMSVHGCAARRRSTEDFAVASVRERCRSQKDLCAADDIGCGQCPERAGKKSNRHAGMQTTPGHHHTHPAFECQYMVVAPLTGERKTLWLHSCKGRRERCAFQKDLRTADDIGCGRCQERAGSKKSKR